MIKGMRFLNGKLQYAVDGGTWHTVQRFDSVDDEAKLKVHSESPDYVRGYEDGLVLGRSQRYDLRASNEQLHEQAREAADLLADAYAMVSFHAAPAAPALYVEAKNTLVKRIVEWRKKAGFNK